VRRIPLSGLFDGANPGQNGSCRFSLVPIEWSRSALCPGTSRGNGLKRKLIEVSLPLEAINRESTREKSIRHDHPSTLHLGWARRKSNFEDVEW
jgi:hypothetical protein